MDRKRDERLARLDEDVEELIVRMATENRSWGYDRIVGALANLGYHASDQTGGAASSGVLTGMNTGASVVASPSPGLMAPRRSISAARVARTGGLK